LIRIKMSDHTLFGRFGGGWNWCVGFQLGKGTLLLNLLIRQVRIDWYKK
tara:strand:+ start:797 stop:943 length:147 start_codon:yes stop_codon:yes gene_type:complete